MAERAEPILDHHEISELGTRDLVAKICEILGEPTERDKRVRLAEVVCTELYCLLGHVVRTAEHEAQSRVRKAIPSVRAAATRSARREFLADSAGFMADVCREWAAKFDARGLTPQANTLRDAASVLEEDG